MYEELKPTSRQLEILQLAANGLVNKQIALKLHISPQTIKNHWTRIRNFMNAETTIHAVAIAIRKGWIE